MASSDGEEPLIDEGEDATPEPKPSLTQQDIPDASRDARLDVDLGSMTAQNGVRNSFRNRFAKVQSLFSNKT